VRFREEELALSSGWPSQSATMKCESTIESRQWRGRGIAETERSTCAVVGLRAGKALQEQDSSFRSSRTKQARGSAGLQRTVLGVQDEGLTAD
jgi:hypothetical protein